jgi:hypothetical protein
VTIAPLPLAADESFFDSATWTVSRNLAVLVVVLLWLATAYWVYKDARLFRPPEYLEDVRERELEIRAIEDRLAERDLRCPVCRGRVESTYLVCPVCTTRLKQACAECGSPLEPLWQACPHCAAPVPPSMLSDDVMQPLPQPRRPRQGR